MQLGMVGLGRMGANMTERLQAAGHDMKTFDTNVEAARPFPRQTDSPLRGGSCMACASMFMPAGRPGA